MHSRDVSRALKRPHQKSLPALHTVTPTSTMFLSRPYSILVLLCALTMVVASVHNGTSGTNSPRRGGASSPTRRDLASRDGSQSPSRRRDATLQRSESSIRRASEATQLAAAAAVREADEKAAAREREEARWRATQDEVIRWKAAQEEALRKRAEELEVQSQNIAARQAALEAEAAREAKIREAALQAGASDTLSTSSRSSSLSRSESMKWRGGFVDFSSPKVFDQVCNYKKVQAKDKDRHVLCNTHCQDLSKRVSEVAEAYPTMTGIGKLTRDCTGFTRGACDKSYAWGHRETSLCTCYDLRDMEEPRTQLASVCRAGLSGFKVAHNLMVATAPVRKTFNKWRKSVSERRKNKKNKKKKEETEE